MSSRNALGLWFLLAGGFIGVAALSRGVAQQPVAGASADAEARQAAVAEAVKRNGPIFADWTPPKYALMFTGDLTGYIEPCGCAGLENLKGGLSRRDALLAAFEQAHWQFAAFDLGGQVRRVGVPQTEMKFQQTVKGLIRMNYAAVGFGADDLRMPAVALLNAATEPDGDRTARFTSANAALFGFESGATARYRTLTVAGKKLGVTSVLGDSLAKSITNEGVTFLPAEQALTEVTAQLAAEKCDDLILLSYAPRAETEALAKKFPQYAIVVTAGGAAEPPGELQRIAGTQTVVIEVGQKGQHAIVLGFFDDPTTPIRYQRVPLDARFPESPRMQALLAEYQDQLRLAGFANLGVAERQHPKFDAADPARTQFAGSEACAKCHKDAFDVWKNSGHAHALETLVNLKPPRQYDPECLSCHVTGWDPQQYVPYQGGFVDATATAHLAGNGCENCHGPGAAHAQAEAGGDATLQQALRAAMKQSTATASQTSCIKCHDHDNSPEYKFETYWPQIEH